MLADAAVANAAEALGKSADAFELRRRSRRYDVLFNQGSHFFQPKSRSGEFKAPFDPIAWRNGFTEGAPWHYRFYVPHDVPGLQRLMGGKLCKYVEDMLTATDGPNFRIGGYWGVTHEMQEAAAIQKRFGLYAHSNQAVHDTLWIAKKAGCHSVADKYLRRTMAELYQLKGYAGDEDNGEMSAWYVLSALGFYQLEPGSSAYVLGSPAVRQAKIRFSNGRTLVIMTQNQSIENVYVTSILWTAPDGRVRKITDNSILHEDLIGGGNLSFVMSPTPLQDSSWTAIP
jgi:predicted alpha-1,2-mannosidase